MRLFENIFTKSAFAKGQVSFVKAANAYSVIDGTRRGNIQVAKPSAVMQRLQALANETFLLFSHLHILVLISTLLFLTTLRLLCHIDELH